MPLIKATAKLVAFWQKDPVEQNERSEPAEYFGGFCLG